MIEYPSIRTSAKIPRAKGIAFDKLDGSNIRVKWTSKKGFELFGTRTQLIDESAEFWGGVVKLFKEKYAQDIDKILAKNFKNDKVILFSEFYGEDSFAGRHSDKKETYKIVPFDLYVEKQKKFLLPQEFIKMFSDTVETPRVVHEGYIGTDLILRVRANEFNLTEGIIFKGTERYGYFSGGVLMCKVKTQEYLDKLKKASYTDPTIDTKE